MYTILGQDGNQYGPVAADEVRRWIAEGRVNEATLIRPEGSQQWRAASTFEEFSEALKEARPGRVPPRLSTSPSPTTAPQERTNALALASLILGVLGAVTCGLTAIVGLVLGLIAFKQSNKAGDSHGRSLAIAGTIVSSVIIVLLPLLAALLLPALAAAREKGARITCTQNVKQLCLGLLMYTAENGGALPTAERWCDAIRNYVGTETVFQCPQGAKTERAHYGFNQKLGGLMLSNISQPAVTVMVFETSGGWNVAGGKELLLSTPRHKSIAIGFADGYCQAIPVDRLDQLRWEP